MFKLKEEQRLETANYNFIPIDDSYNCFQDYAANLEEEDDEPDSYLRELALQQEMVDEASTTSISFSRLHQLAARKYKKELQLIQEFHTCGRCHKRYQEAHNYSWNCQYHPCSAITSSLVNSQLNCCGFGLGRDGRLLESHLAAGCTHCDHISNTTPALFDNVKLPWIFVQSGLIKIDPKVVKACIKDNQNKLVWHYRVHRSEATCYNHNNNKSSSSA